MSYINREVARRERIRNGARYGGASGMMTAYKRVVLTEVRGKKPKDVEKILLWCRTMKTIKAHCGAPGCDAVFESIDSDKAIDELNEHWRKEHLVYYGWGAPGCHPRIEIFVDTKE